MTTCDVLNCLNDWNVWKVSNSSKNVPRYEDFRVCDHHLHLHPEMTQMQAALVRGRFDGQNGNEVTFGNWKLVKELSTWKHNQEDPDKCDKCESTQKIWITCQKINEQKDSDNESSESQEHSVEERVKILCDVHLLRHKYGDNPQICIYNNSDGIYTQETTWTIPPEEPAEAPIKKRKGK